MLFISFVWGAKIWFISHPRYSYTPVNRWFTGVFIS